MTAPFRPLALLLLAAGGLLPACTSNCMQVQNLLCECQFQTQNERNSCEDAASAQAALQEPTAQQEQTCSTYVTRCQKYIDAHPPVGTSCPAVQTVEGRTECGIAASP